MNRLECLARLVALEHGLRQSKWPEFKKEAENALRTFPLTTAEIFGEMPDAKAVIRRKARLFKSSKGRQKMIREAEECRLHRLTLN